jgi:hypothetical protein
MSKEGTVIIEVGLDHEKYYIHRALLVHHSEYFAKALRGSWKEAQEGIVKLEDIGTEECKSHFIFKTLSICFSAQMNHKLNLY